MLSLALALSLVPAWAGTQRLALLAGANDGGPGRVTLRYAVDDAEALGRVLEDLGGFAPEDVLLLADPDLGELSAGLSQLASLIEGAHAVGDRAEVIVYYSGHSDEHGLRLSGDELAYDALRAELEALGADVTVVILDSCASGALVRGKGGVHKPPFLSDESVQVQGYAYLTSASADEAAQEADRIGGSYFTHALVTGLRGGADASGDQRVTLNEAYHFAYDQTLALTERTVGGAQHANYDIRLMGTGDLVLTDMSGVEAALSVGAEVSGRLFVRDADGQLVAELGKPAGRALDLGLDPGRYNVLLEDGAFLGEAVVVLERGKQTRLERSDFRAVSAELARARGDIVYTRVPFNVGILPQVSLGAQREGPYQHNVDLSLGVAGTDWARGLQAAVGGALARDRVDGLQAAAGAAWSGGEVHGLQAAAGMSWAGGEVRGLQAAAAIAVAQGSVTGLQSAAGLAVAQSVHGAQLGAGVGVAQDVDGLQGNVVTVAGRVHGAQLGVVNIAREVDGLQLGVVNIADDVDGLPLGLITIHRAGYNTLGAWSSESSHGALSLTYGGKRVYTLLELGARAQAEGAPRLDAAVGFGLHSPLGQRLALDVDLAALNSSVGFSGESLHLVARSRALLDLQVAGPLHVFAGPSLNGVVWNGSGTPYGLSLVPSWSPLDEAGLYPIWVGGTAGLRLRLGRQGS
ncbi:MAG: caspase family protein [Alphaproteobacteria bacterium]|nr:caspase family protein [Alphaproteobacteria bacterium]